MITTNIRPISNHNYSGNITTQSQHQITTGIMNTDTETDPIFRHSPAYGITEQDIENWNAGGAADLSSYVTYEYLSAQAYLTSVTFPDYSSTYQSKGDYITPDVLASQAYLTSETDPVFSASPAGSITDTDIANWNAAAGTIDMGAYVTKAQLAAQSYVTTSDLAAQSYLTTETDPVFSASPAAGITSEDIENWNAGGAVDLSSYVTYEYLSAQSYLTSVTFPDYSSTYQAKGNYLTTETDPVFSASPAAGITSEDIENWNSGASVDLSSYVTKSELAAQSYIKASTASGSYIVNLDKNLYVQNFGGSIDLTNFTTIDNIYDICSVTMMVEPGNNNSYSAWIEPYIQHISNGTYNVTISLGVRNGTAESLLSLKPNKIQMTTDQVMISGVSSNSLSELYVGGPVYLKNGEYYYLAASYEYVLKQIGTYVVSQSYLTSETDPVFSASPAAGITSEDIENWNSGASVDLSSYLKKSELAAQSYVTSTSLENMGYITQSDIVFPDYSSTYQAKGDYVTSTELANKSYVTKNELAAQSYVTSTSLENMGYITQSDIVFPDYSSTYQAKGNYLTSESDPIFSASPAAGITAADIARWDNGGGAADLTAYVKKSELAAQSYVTSRQLAAQSYVTSTALANCAYTRIKLVTQSQYVDRMDNILYIITDAPPIS